MLGAITPDILLVLVIIVITIFLFATAIIRVDVVACLVLVFLGLTKLVPSQQLFLGFSSEAVIALIGIMIICAGLERSGVVAKLAHFIMRLGKNEHMICLLLMGIGGFCAGFLRSVGTVALFLPVVTRIRRATGISKRRLLIPLSFCAILGSTLTMLGTGPLILLNSLLISVQGLTDRFGQASPLLGLFSVFPIGLVLLLMGIIYFSVLGKWLLPKRLAADLVNTNGGSPAYFKRVYGIGTDFCECRVPMSSPLANNTLHQWEALLPPGIAIIGLKVGNHIHTPALRTVEIKEGSVVALLGSHLEIQEFAKKYSLRMSPYLMAFAEQLGPVYAGLCEAVVPPSSQLLGTNLSDLHMRRQYGIQVLAVHRGDKVRYSKQEMSELTLRAGDALGMFCQWNALLNLQNNPDFVVITSDIPRHKLHTEKMGFALFYFLLAIGLIMIVNLSVAVALLVGAIGMIFSGVISVDEAYEAVSWKTVFLLAGLMPLGIAVQTSGTSDWLGQHLLKFFAHSPAWVLLFILGMMASLASLVLTNVGATIILVPLSVHLAHALQADPRAFALMVAVATSNSFVLPTHQANALINLPGEYKVIDFIKAGGLMSVLYIVVVAGMIYWMF